MGITPLPAQLEDQGQAQSGGGRLFGVGSVINSWGFSPKPCVRPRHGLQDLGRVGSKRYLKLSPSFTFGEWLAVLDSATASLS